MAKINIIALKFNNKIVNLLTTIKMTHYDEKQQAMSFVDELNCGNKSFIIYEGYLCEESLDHFQDDMLNNKEIIINAQTISYEVDEIPRSSFLLQIEDFYADKYNQITSPFYSNCYLDEYWNKNLDIKNLWLEIEEENRLKIRPYLDINLDYLIDKVGNVLKFIQVDEVDVSVAHHCDYFITLGFKINTDNCDKKFVSNKYIVNVEVKSASDLILKRAYEINTKYIDIELQDADNNILIEVYNLNSNKCVYKRNMKFFGGGNPIIHQIKKDITTTPNQNTIVKLRNNNQEYEISSLENIRTRWTRTIKRKDESEFVRFDDTEKKEAFDYLIKTLKDLAKHKGLEDKLPEYIYLVDPYLFCDMSSDDFAKVLSVSTINEFKNIEFRLIGCQNSIPEHFIDEIIKNPHLYKNVKIKSIRKKEKDTLGNILPPFPQPDGSVEYKTKATFHDRFMATKHIEYGFTNSVNNLKKGVTYFRSFDVYFDDAEALWNAAINNELLIEVV